MTFVTAFFLIGGLGFIAVWIGGSEHAEELYVNNCVDKSIIKRVAWGTTIARKLALSVGALASIVLLNENNPDKYNLTRQFALFIGLFQLAVFAASKCLFKEVSLHSRISHFTD